MPFVVGVQVNRVHFWRQPPVIVLRLTQINGGISICGNLYYIARSFATHSSGTFSLVVIILGDRRPRAFIFFWCSLPVRHYIIVFHWTATSNSKTTAITRFDYRNGNLSPIE